MSTRLSELKAKAEDLSAQLSEVKREIRAIKLEQLKQNAGFAVGVLASRKLNETKQTYLITQITMKDTDNDAVAFLYGCRLKKDGTPSKRAVYMGMYPYTNLVVEEVTKEN